MSRLLHVVHAACIEHRPLYISILAVMRLVLAGIAHCGRASDDVMKQELVEKATSVMESH